MPFKFADIPGVFQERKPPTPIDFSGLHQQYHRQQCLGYTGKKIQR
jgi:hypothetical protein